MGLEFDAQITDLDVIERAKLEAASPDRLLLPRCSATSAVMLPSASGMRPATRVALEMVASFAIL